MNNRVYPYKGAFNVNRYSRQTASIDETLGFFKGAYWSYIKYWHSRSPENLHASPVIDFDDFVKLYTVSFSKYINFCITIINITYTVIKNCLITGICLGSAQRSRVQQWSERNEPFWICNTDSQPQCIPWCSQRTTTDGFDWVQYQFNNNNRIYGSQELLDC